MSTRRDDLVAAIVLAAGSSSRLGTNKLLLELEGEAIVRRAARRALEAGLRPVTVVLGFEAERVAAALVGLDVVLTINPDYAAGMHTSLRAGIARTPPECGAAVVLLADMPLVTPQMVASLVARYRAGSEPLVLSCYGDAQAPPSLYSRGLFPALLAAGEGAGRRVARDYRAEAATLEWPRDRLADLDRPEDVARVRGLAAG